MPTVEKTSGGKVYIRPLERRFEIGDRAGVDDEMAEYLCEERGDFEHADDVTDVEFEETDGTDEDTDAGDVGEDGSVEELPEPDNLASDGGNGGLGDMTKGELYEIASEQDVDGRSDMTKNELIDAVEEA